MTDLDRLERAATAQGFRVTQGTRHRKWFSPDGRLVAITPADHRGKEKRGARHTQNILAQLRRAGLRL